MRQPALNIRRLSALGGLLFSSALLIFAGYRWATADWITDEMIRGTFIKSHNVMSDQKDRLNHIFDAFLMGDFVNLETQTDLLIADIKSNILKKKRQDT